MFTLGSFEKVPVPEMDQHFKYRYSIHVPFLILSSRFGTHAIVCCPGYSSSAIFFPTDPAHPEYEYVGGDYYDGDVAELEDSYDGAKSEDSYDGAGSEDYYDGGTNAQLQKPTKVILSKHCEVLVSCSGRK